MFGIITNTIEGITEVAVNTVKLPIAVVAEPFIDDKSPTEETFKRIVEGVDKIGKSD